MANISTYLQKILDAVYGEEVRGSIHDALDAMNTESSNAMTFAKTAKDSAANSAAAAKESETVAGEKATEASESASAANDSATKAQASENAATQKVTEASTAAAGAMKSEKNAAASARAAQTFKEDAEAALQNTESAKDEAVKSASAAAKSAESAKQYSGKPPKIQNGTWWIWDADAGEAGEYYDTHLTSTIPGPIGIGIRDISLTSGNHAPGTSDVYTVTLTNDTEYTISVYNGRNGEGAGDVLGKSFDLVIPKDSWIDGQAIVADERLVALATYKYLIAAHASCRDEYDDCYVRAKDITESGFITFLNDTDPQKDLTVNVLRFELSDNG